MYQYYNRISTARLINKDQLPNRAKSADKVNDRSADSDDIYDELDYMDIMALRDEALTQEEQYSRIYTAVELYSELKDAIEKMCDCAIVPDGSGRFVSLEVDNNVDTFLMKQIQDSHDRVMSMLGFDDHREAWKRFYEWSCFGKVAWLYEYEFKTRKKLLDEASKIKRQLNLIDVRFDETSIKLTESKNKRYERILEKLNSEKKAKKKLLEAVTNQAKFESFRPSENGNEEDDLIAVDIKKIKVVNFLEIRRTTVKETGKTYYTYRDRIYSDNEICIIDYNDISGNHLPINRYGTMVNTVRKVSYAHKLMRNWNLLNRMETTVVSWTIMNAMYRQITTIPITTKVASKAKEAISKMRNKYMDNFSVDHDGNVKINGEGTYNTMKHIVLGDRGGNKPEVGTVQWNGYDLSEMKEVNYFRNRFMDATKLPYSRFDKEGEKGGLSIYKADGVPFTEVSFYAYLDRILHQFGFAIKKPTILLVNLADPKTTLDESLPKKIRYNWESMDHYYQARTSERQTKMLSEIGEMARLEDGNGEPVFPMKYLLTRKFKFMSDEEWNEMEMMKKELNLGDEDKGDIGAELENI